MNRIAVQIYLDPEQDRVLSQLSKARKRSKAAIIRSCIEDYLSRLPPEEDPILEIIGLGESGRTDLSEEHDRHLCDLED